MDKKKPSSNIVQFVNPKVEEKKIKEKQISRESQKQTKDPLHQPTVYKYLDDKGWWAKDKGVSEAGALTRDYKYFTPEMKEHDKSYSAGAYGHHKKVLNALKAMKKPDLPKSETVTKSEDLEKAVKIGVSPQKLKEKSSNEPSAKPQLKENPAELKPTHVSGVEIPHELHEHQGVVPREHPHREIAAKFVTDVWRKNKFEGKRLSEKYLGVKEHDPNQKPTTSQQYTTIKSEGLNKVDDLKKLKNALKAKYKETINKPVVSMPNPNPKDPILSYDIKNVKGRKMDMKKALEIVNEMINTLKKAEQHPEYKIKQLDKEVIKENAKPVRAKPEEMNKIDPQTKLPGVLLNKDEHTIKLCKALKGMMKTLEASEGMGKPQMPKVGNPIKTEAMKAPKAEKPMAESKVVPAIKKDEGSEQNKIPMAASENKKTE